MNKLQCELDIIRFLNENAMNINHNVLNESVQSNLSDAVLGKMFELTVGKYSKIDFSDIERSRGDITKIKYYANLRECIDILLDIHTVSNKIPGILAVSVALSNMLNLKKAFEHAKNLLTKMLKNFTDQNIKIVPNKEPMKLKKKSIKD